MGREITIIVKDGQNVISSNSVAEGSGRPLVIKAKPGYSFELKNMTKGVAPDQIYVVRDGENLKIKIGKKAKHSDNSDKSDDNADIIIEAYFEHDCNLIGAAENGQYYNYIPQGADPEASYYSLGGETIVESETDWLPIILGVLGAGAIAAAAGGGGGSDTPPPEPYPPADTTPPESLTVTVYADNKEPNSVIITTEKGTISIGSDSGVPLTNDNTPVIKGRTEAGATVTARDEAGNILGTATADSDGNYTIVPTTPLSEGQHYISATAADAAGNTISANTAIFEVDTIAPEAPIINPTDGSQISGTSEAGSTVILTDDNGNLIGTTEADSNGHFTYTPDTPLTHGTEIVATATDTAGNVSEEGYGEVNSAIPDTPMVYDDIAPVIGEIENNSITDDTLPTITGSGAGADLSINVYDNGVLLGTTTSDENGLWSVEPSTPFADGSQHSITYTVNEGPESPAVQFTVDTAAPDAITMVITDDVAPITGTIDNNGTTDDTTPTISGTTEPGAIVTIKDGDTLLGTVTADENGGYIFTPTTPLDEGAHSVSATATDEAGNSVDSPTTHFTVDTATPTVEVDITAITDDTGTPDDFITNDSTLVFSGTNDPLGEGEKIQVSLDSGTTWMDVDQTTETHWSYDNTANTMSDGNYTVEARVIDAAGNTGTPVSQDIVVDTTAPTSDVSITAIADDTGTPDDFITSDNTLIFNGTNGQLEEGEKIQISLDGGATWMDAMQTDATHWSYDNTGNSLADGNYTVEARVIDAAGNVGNTDNQEVVIDKTAPTATSSITAITTDTGAEGDFITSDTTLVIDGTNTELGANERVQISLDGGTTWVDTVQSDSAHWSYNNEANALISGEHTLQTRVIDSAGNTGEVSSQTITIDTAAPTTLSVNLDDDETPVTGPITAGTTTDDTTPIISGQTEEGAFVTAKDDAGNVLGTATADSHGNYTITPTAELSEGLHYIQVTAEDTAGNDMTVSSVIFTVDTTAPDTPLLDPTDGSQVVGTAEPGSTITITDGNGDPIGTTTTNQNGNFSYIPDTLIPDTTVITATAMDPAGNESLPGTTTVDATITEAPVIMDDVDPVQGQVLNGDTTNDVFPDISGSAGSVPANVTVTIYDNGSKIGETTSNANGSWSFTPDTPFNDGSNHSITYTKNGSTTNYSPAVDFTVDTTAPTITMVLNDDVDPITGDITDGSTTNDTRPTISGVTEAGATVTIKDGATVLGTTTADSSGNYTFTPIAPLNEGSHAISAIATDAAGNSVTGTTTGFTVDSIAPTVEMTITDDVGTAQGPVSNGATIDDTKPTISGTTEPGATVTIKDGNTVLGTVTADSNGDYTFTPDESLSMDEHTITATATDTAGNTTTSTSTTFTIAPPEVIDLGEDGQLIHPVFVDGNYYYYWDRDGDGEGKIEGASDMGDWFTHDDLDDIFMYDENGNMRPDDLPDTDDTYRYAELGGYELALPTYGGDMTNDGPQHGTSIDNTPPGEINPIYDDLVAIWDAFNGGETTTTAVPGVPEGWSEGLYWSATQYNVEKHYAMDLTNGLGATNGEHDNYWVAVQVIF